MSQADKKVKKAQEKKLNAEGLFIVANETGVHYSGKGEDLLSLYLDISVQLINKVFLPGDPIEKKLELVDALIEDVKAGIVSSNTKKVEGEENAE